MKVYTIEKVTFYEGSSIVAIRTDRDAAIAEAWQIESKRDQLFCDAIRVYEFDTDEPVDKHFRGIGERVFEIDLG